MKCFTALFLFVLFCFTIGDEYMLNESLTNQDSDRRRSVSPNQAAIGIQQLRQLHQAGKNAEPKQVTEKTPITTTTVKPIIIVTTSEKSIVNASSRADIGTGRAINHRRGPPPPVIYPQRILMHGLPPLPPFKPIPSNPSRISSPLKLQSSAAPLKLDLLPTSLNNVSRPYRLAGYQAVASPTVGAKLPSFQAMPLSVVQATEVNRQRTPNNEPAFPNGMQVFDVHYVPKPQSPFPPAPVVNNLPQNVLQNRQDNSLAILTGPTAHRDDIYLMSQAIQRIAQANNVSVEALTAALIARKQQQILANSITTSRLPPPPPTTTTTTTTTTTQRPPTTTMKPLKKYSLSSTGHKVMNAPKEYYPANYDKNFDDNFASRVELPDTQFYCGEQKHFPGLYADEDLGCMVFHVCAFTDDGLIMKSFLCPESTLFDQTILKCNWWFYVDCKSSKRLYDSNIPVSKSYQLMKALAFFSGYNKPAAATAATTASTVGKS